MKHLNQEDMKSSEKLVGLSDQDYELVAEALGCEPAVVQALQIVESGGRGGFVAPGMPTMLFEGHVFWRELLKRRINPKEFAKGNEDILYPRWSRKHYLGGVAEYDRLERAIAIHQEAALAAASWGMFQIMGFNHSLCEIPSVIEIVEAMQENEASQLQLLGRFLKHAGMMPALQRKDWKRFAMLYNGPGYDRNAYDVKLECAYQTLIR